MSDLFSVETAEEASSPIKRAATEVKSDGPVMVSDGTQIARLIEEVLASMKPGDDEVAEWKNAGHRTRIIEEHPFIVEQIVAAKITERRFKLMVEGALRPNEVGTQLHLLTTLQYNGLWRIASFSVRPGTTVRMDGERRMADAIQGTAEDDLRFINGATELAPQTKATVRWRIEWIDANGATDIKRDIHGREPQAMEVLDGSRTSQNAVMAAMANAVTKLAEAVQPKAETPAAAPAEGEEKKLDGRTREARALRGQ